MTDATKKTAKKPFTDEERAAMKAHAKEMKAAEDREAGEKAVIEAIAAMQQPDRAMAERLHTVITTSAPALAPRTWYGMPAYAMNGNVVCFFQSAQKFKTRYATFGFSDKANLDDGDLWPSAYALKKLTPAVEKKIVELVKKAVS